MCYLLNTNNHKFFTIKGVHNGCPFLLSKHFYNNRNIINCHRSHTTGIQSYFYIYFIICGDKINEIRARNGWRIEIECVGIWIATVYDKQTDEMLGETGAGSLQGILIALKTPLDHPVWAG
jgi:hypothetical protein